MTETEDREPKDKKDFKSFQYVPHAEDMQDFFRRHRVSRALANSLFRLIIYTNLLFTKSGHELLKDSVRRKFLFERERRVGFLEDSILNPDLYYPNEKGTSLELSCAPPGRYTGYDFRRPQEFGLKDGVHGLRKSEGRIGVFALDEIKNHNANTYTPTDLLNIFDICHILTLEVPPLEEVISQGYLRETTYGEAYEKVGLYQRYRLFLAHSGIVNNPVYAVTPKGNSVVILIEDQGKKVEKPKAVPEFKPVFEV